MPSSGTHEVVRSERALAREAAHDMLVGHLVVQLMLGRQVPSILEDEVVDQWVKRSWRRIDAALSDPRVAAVRRR